MNWEAVGLGLAALLWVAWLDKAWALRWQGSDRAQRIECACFFGAAACLTLQLPTLADAADRSVGVPGVTGLLANIVGIIAAWLFYPCLLRLWVPTATGRRILTSGWLTFGTAIALLALFLFLPMTSTLPSMPRQAVSPFTLYHQSFAYTLVYMGYLGSMVFQMFLITLREGRRVVRSPLTPSRLRLQVGAQTVGWAAGVAFATHESAYALLRQQDLPYPLFAPAVVSNALLAVAVLGVTSGELQAPWRWAEQYLSYRRLYPLWRLLYQANPAIALTALFPPVQSVVVDVVKANQITLRRLRRVVEIRDGILALRPFGDERVAARADERCRSARLGPAERQAVIEAATLVVASRVHNSAVRAARPPTESEMLRFASPDSFEEEVAYLEQVSKAIKHSPLVTAVVEEQRVSGERVGATHAPAEQPGIAP